MYYLVCGMGGFFSGGKRGSLVGETEGGCVSDLGFTKL